VADTDLQWGELGLVVPSWRSGRLGRSLCEADVRGYGGILGKVLDERIGIDTLLACGTRRDLEVGPCGDKARLGLPWSAWAALGTAPGEDVAVAGLALPGRAACLAGGPAIPMANGDESPFRSYFPGEITKQSLAFQIPADRVLVVLNQFPVLNVMDELVVSADGHTMAPLWQDRATALFRCTDCSGNAEWRVSYRTVNTEQVYVIALDAD
jgi:hypothetical protein